MINFEDNKAFLDEKEYAYDLAAQIIGREYKKFRELALGDNTFLGTDIFKNNLANKITNAPEYYKKYIMDAIVSVEKELYEKGDINSSNIVNNIKNIKNGFNIYEIASAMSPKVIVTDLFTENNPSNYGNMKATYMNMSFDFKFDTVEHNGKENICVVYSRNNRPIIPVCPPDNYTHEAMVLGGIKASLEHVKILVRLYLSSAVR